MPSDVQFSGDYVLVDADGDVFVDDSGCCCDELPSGPCCDPPPSCVRYDLLRHVGDLPGGGFRPIPVFESQGSGSVQLTFDQILTGPSAAIDASGAVAAVYNEYPFWYLGQSHPGPAEPYWEALRHLGITDPNGYARAAVLSGLTCRRYVWSTPWANGPNYSFRMHWCCAAYYESGSETPVFIFPDDESDRELFSPAWNAPFGSAAPFEHLRPFIAVRENDATGTGSGSGFQPHWLGQPSPYDQLIYSPTGLGGMQAWAGRNYNNDLTDWNGSTFYFACSSQTGTGTDEGGFTSAYNALLGNDRETPPDDPTYDPIAAEFGNVYLFWNLAAGDCDDQEPPPFGYSCNDYYYCVEDPDSAQTFMECQENCPP